MILTPTSRREQYYDAIANGSTDVHDPISREEQYLKAIAENGGSLPSGTNEGDILYWHNSDWAVGGIDNAVIGA